MPVKTDSLGKSRVPLRRHHVGLHIPLHLVTPGPSLPLLPHRSKQPSAPLQTDVLRHTHTEESCVTALGLVPPAFPSPSLAQVSQLHKEMATVAATSLTQLPVRHCHRRLGLSQVTWSINHFSMETSCWDEVPVKCKFQVTNGQEYFISLAAEFLHFPQLHKFLYLILGRGLDGTSTTVLPLPHMSFCSSCVG